MSIRKYGLASLPDRRVHRQASPALRHLAVAHSTPQGIFESLHVVRLAAADVSGKDARGRLNEGEVDLLRSALVLAGAGLDAVLKRLGSGRAAGTACRRIDPGRCRQGVQGARLGADP